MNMSHSGRQADGAGLLRRNGQNNNDSQNNNSFSVGTSSSRFAKFMNKGGGNEGRGRNTPAAPEEPSYTKAVMKSIMPFLFTPG